MSKTLVPPTDRQVLLFVYGTLRSGQPLNYLLRDIGGQFVSDAAITNRDYIMRSMGNYPALHYVGNGKGQERITGELWVVPTDKMDEIDAVEGINYGRKYTHVQSSDLTAPACIYYLKDEEYAKILPAIPGGEWEGDDDFVDNTESICMAGYEGSEDLFQQGCAVGYENLDEFEDDEVDEDSEETPENIDFTVEAGVYVVNDAGEFWGPFDDIASAVKAIAEDLTDVFDDVTTLTVGFRMVRSDLTDDQLAEIDAVTINNLTS